MINSADPDQKPTDLDLHCLLRQSMSCSAREGLSITGIFFRNRVLAAPPMTQNIGPKTIIHPKNSAQPGIVLPLYFAGV